MLATSGESTGSVAGLGALLAETALLAGFLGVCTFLLSGRKRDGDFGLTLILAQVVTVPLGWALQELALGPRALVWAGLPDADVGGVPLLAGAAGATVLAVKLGAVAAKQAPRLLHALARNAPLIAGNCAILGAPLFMEYARLSLAEAAVYALGSGTGWALVLAGAAIRAKARAAPAAPPGESYFAFAATGGLASAVMAFTAL